MSMMTHWHDGDDKYRHQEDTAKSPTTGQPGFIGAEATEVYAKLTGHGVEPSEYAARVVEEEREETQ